MPKTVKRLTQRTACMRTRLLADASLDGQELEVYKHDERSRVWRVIGPHGPCVVKRFEYDSKRQTIALALGLHPAQREIRGQRLLAEKRLPHVASIDAGRDTHGRVWLATPFVGPTIQSQLPQHAASWIEPIVKLFEDIWSAGLSFKDFKPSNLVIMDEPSRVIAPIDVGSVTTDVSARKRDQMLAVMQRVLRRDGVDEAMVQRFVVLVESK